MNKELFEKLKLKESQTLTISAMATKILKGRLNLSPKYQRGDVWPVEYRRDLIQSIFMGLQIPPLYLVQEESKSGHIALDGKQRITTIDKFIKNEFDVVHPDFTDKSFFYRDLANSEDKRIQEVAELFDNFSLSYTQLPPMKVSLQEELFSIINHSKELALNDQIYCKYYMTKSLLQYIWDKTLSSYTNVFNVPFKVADFTKKGKIRKPKGDSNKHIRYLHSILFGLYGHTLSESKASFRAGRNTNKRVITEASKFLHKQLIDIVEDDGNIIDNTIEKMGINKQLESFITMSRILKNIFEYRTVSKWDRNVVRDSFYLLMTLNDENCFTTSNIKEYTPILYDILSNYRPGKEFNKSTGDKNTIIARMKYFEEYFRSTCTNLGIDLNPKRKELSDSQKSIARFKSNGKCPVPGCGKDLTLENSHVDHLLPKSKFSNTVAILICKECNQRKTNFSLEELDNYKKYIENNLEEVSGQ